MSHLFFFPRLSLNKQIIIKNNINKTKKGLYQCVKGPPKKNCFLIADDAERHVAQ